MRKIFLMGFFLFLTTAVFAKGNNIDLVVFHAGSLSVPLKTVITEFNKQYPNILIKPESAGSIDCVRKITDLGRNCDVIAVADYKVIEEFLIPKYADWNLKFASNEIVIAYNDKSKYAKEINTQNWYSILTKRDVIYGRANPNSDPCGYRSIFTIKLAEDFYQQPGLTDRFLNKDEKFIRPKEVDLLALLETNTIDYLFIYRSVAEQHNLKFVILPDEINLKSPKFEKSYSQISVEVTGKTPGSTVKITAIPMVYGISIPKNAEHKKEAIQFVDFLLSKDNGQKILAQMGQPSVIPAPTTTYAQIPTLLKKYALETK